MTRHEKKSTALFHPLERRKTDETSVRLRPGMLAPAIATAEMVVANRKR